MAFDMPAVPIFWIIALLMVAATVGALSWPLLRAQSRAPDPDDAAATDVYRDQTRHLVDEMAAGSITRSEYDANLQELTSRLGAELTAPAASAAPSRLPFVAALMLVALLPVSALVLYVTLGNPNAIRGAVQASERAPMSPRPSTAVPLVTTATRLPRAV